MPDLSNQLSKCIDLFRVTNVFVGKCVHRWLRAGNGDSALGQTSRVDDHFSHICILTEILTWQ